MFYLIDEEGELYTANTLNDLLKEADQPGGAYGEMENWLIFQGNKLDVEKKVDYIVKTKPEAKKPVAKKPSTLK